MKLGRPAWRPRSALAERSASRTCSWLKNGHNRRQQPREFCCSSPAGSSSGRNLVSFRFFIMGNDALMADDPAVPRAGKAHGRDVLIGLDRSQGPPRFAGINGSAHLILALAEYMADLLIKKMQSQQEVIL